MRKLILTAALTAIASPAFATGKVTCDTPKDTWQPRETLEARLVEEGWKVRKSKVDGGCYEVYGTLPTGERVEAYFDPANFEKLYVAQRGKVLFKKEK